MKKGAQTEISQIHEYYTPNLNKMQGILVIFTIFVDYAHFYVNMIMSTVKTAKPKIIHFLFINTYVALSRCRRHKMLILQVFLQKDSCR